MPYMAPNIIAPLLAWAAWLLGKLAFALWVTIQRIGWTGLVWIARATLAVAFRKVWRWLTEERPTTAMTPEAPKEPLVLEGLRDRKAEKPTDPNMASHMVPKNRVA